MDKIRVTVWNEFRGEVHRENVKRVYPEGIHTVLAEFLTQDEKFIVRTATFADEDYGLSQKLLDETDVLLFWAHEIHHLLPDEVAARVQKRVLEGMGFIALHSATYSKPFERLTGAIMMSAYREVGEKERVWVVNPAHEIARGVPQFFEVPHTEVYREPTGLPMPDELVFVSWYAGGEIGLSGGCYYRGRGRVFYFTPGHEEYPIYYDKMIQKVIINAVRWAYNPWRVDYENGPVPPYETLDPETLWKE